LEIFEQYFYDLSQLQKTLGNNSARYDVADMLKEKIQIFNKPSLVVVNGDSLPRNIEDKFDQIGDCWTQPNAAATIPPTADALNPHESAKRVELVDVEHLVTTQSGPLTKATNNRPIFYLNHNQIFFLPQSIPGVSYKLNTIRKPISPNWTYLIDPNIASNALYNSDAVDHRDFELHSSEEGKLVNKILQLAGINMKDYNLAQLAGQKEASIKQQEKQ